MEEQKASRQRGLLELDSLGEAAIQERTHCDDKCD